MAEDNERMTTGVVARYILLVLLWGTTWAAIKVGVSAVPPWVFAFERAVAVSVVLTLVSLALRLPFPRDRRTIAAAAISGIVNSGSSWAIIFWSEQYVPSGLVSVFGAAGPIWTAVFAHFMVHGDRLSPVKVGGLLLGIAGIVVLVGAPDIGTHPEALLASVLLALMPISWGLATIVQVRVLREGSALALVAVGMWAGALVLLPLALTQITEPQAWTLDVLIAFGYLVLFGSCVGLVLQLWLTRHLRPTTMTLSQLLISAQALMVGAVALGESITWRMLAGAGLVAAALILNAISGSRGRDAAAPAASPAD